MARVQRGVYRLVHFPAGEHEDLVAVWLWSGQIGVFSHATALALHQLPDVLPHKIHLSVPQSWALRRVSIPPDVSRHDAEVPILQRSWFGPVPVTSVRRTRSDCAQARLSPEPLQQALRQARQRGLLLLRVQALLDFFLLDPLPFTVVDGGFQASVVECVDRGIVGFKHSTVRG
jgi:predicted transcriptional regulator of viral defense system